MKLCAIEGCGQPTGTSGTGRGLCKLHYYRWYRSVGKRAPRPSVTERFWSKVDADGPCWQWTGARLADGYGQFAAALGSTLAHRIAWEMLVGPIPRGLVIDHLCRNRACVNPDHLEIVTPAENTRRGWPARATQCKHGHWYTAANTRRDAKDNRYCLTCDRIREQSRRRTA